MSSFSACLYRDSLYTPWGFRIQGGADFHTPILVQRVFTGSPAEGELQRGDVILSIANYDASSLSHNEAQELIANSGGSLQLSVRRAGGGRGRGQSTGPAPRVHYQQHQQQQYQQQYHPHHQQQQQQQQHQPGRATFRPTARKHEFGVQYGAVPRTKSEGAYAQQHDTFNRQQMPQHNRASTAVHADSFMMDQVNRSLATMDLQSAQQQHNDDQDIDYSFMHQSVSERKKAFMQPVRNTSNYYSAPRNSGAGGGAGSKFRHKQPPNPMLGQRVPDFGWSPSAEKMRQARHGGPSPAAFEQQSYLPSMGYTAPTSPKMRSAAPSANFGQGNVTVRLGAHAPQTESAASAALAAGIEPEPVALNAKQYNTPINLYSKQHVNEVFEGQPNANAAGLGQQPPAAINQSQVYKLVHEQDSQRSSGHRQQQQQPQRQQQLAPWQRQESEQDDTGTSQF